MESTEKGECSRKNTFSDDEKPLKKARYVWEIKGKHHLKKCTKPREEDSTSHENTVSEGRVPEEDIQRHNDCCIQTFLSKTEDIMDRVDLSLDCSDDDSQKSPLECVIETEIPVTLVSTIQRNQDYYLRKWQARQIARGFVDNTINSMLESWVDRPFDPANLVDDCENDGQLEDDAILMAIQAHGLQPNHHNFLQNPLSETESDREQDMPGNSFSANAVSDNLVNVQKEQENECPSFSTTFSSSQFEADPTDFLNAAVSVAIQKKGLTYG